VTSWPAYFSILGVASPNPAALQEILLKSIKNSKAKGYHSDRTNFSAIQASGTSSILKKGESYKASGKLKKIKMEESWGFVGGTKFLDASCLVYDERGYVKTDGLCDWSHHSAQSGAIVHSGDVIDGAKCTGKHTIRVNLLQLPATVKALYFTMTAFSGNLTDIKQPFVRFTDEESDEELCR
jgi:stress response protein SCP2